MELNNKLVYGTTQTSENEVTLFAVNKNSAELWIFSQGTSDVLALDVNGARSLLYLLQIYNPGIQINSRIKTGGYTMNFYSGLTETICISQKQTCVYLEPAFLSNFKYILNSAVYEMEKE